MFENIKKIFINKKEQEQNSKFSILVVEDSPVDRLFLEKTIRNAGYTVAVAETGEQGLLMLGQQAFQLIVLDCMLPGISGIDVCRRLKDNKASAHIPVIFLTGIDTPKNVIDCYDFGAEFFLSKPIGARELLSKISQVLHIPAKA